MQYTYEQLSTLSPREYLQAVWQEDGTKVLEAIDSVTLTPMTMKDFLDHCTTYGGNWGAMLLSGIKKLYPTVWDAIPDDMGAFSWEAICTLCIVLQITTKEGGAI